MRITNKKLILILSVFVIITGMIIFNIIPNNKSRALEEVKLKGSNENNSNMFAIMIKQTDGTYKESEGNTLPQKEDGYIFNPSMSECIDANGNNLGEVLSYRNNMIKLRVKDAAYCYLYFDIISEGDFCIDRGITNLRDCLLVSEDYSYDTGEAIDYINSKGSATTSEIAPTIKFAKKITSEENENGVTIAYSNFTFGSSYSFNESTGMYTLKNYIVDTISDKYINYYTCGNSVGAWMSCNTMYQVKAYKVSGTTQYITSADVYTYNSVDSFDSEVGLYKTEDADGDTYFYRGAVKNNYVSYGGFIWRVVRINGNGSVRMIYSGTSTDATGSDTSIGTSAFNTKYWDPTYVGYKYGEDLVKRETEELATYVNIVSGYVYYYGAGYVPTSDGRFQLDQTKTIKSGKWSEVHEDVIANTPYTCLRTSATGDCDVVLHLKEYVSSSSAKAYYISNNSKDYASTLTNTTDSTIKGVIDTWYEANIKDKTDDVGNQLSIYLSDEIFCNDRSVYSGTGYMLDSNTSYDIKNRLSKNIPTLMCNQKEDEFSVANGNLIYPIALLTGDEVIYAGGYSNVVNDKYYLYNGDYYWLMSPGAYESGVNYVTMYHVRPTGYPYSSNVIRNYGVRPVINLNANVKVASGNGTTSNPYVVTL